MTLIMWVIIILSITYAHYVEYCFSVDEKINHWYEKTLALYGIHVELFNLSQRSENDYRIRTNPGFLFLPAPLYSLQLKDRQMKLWVAQSLKLYYNLEALKKAENGKILSKAGNDHHIEQLNFPFNDNKK